MGNDYSTKPLLTIGYVSITQDSVPFDHTFDNID